MRRKVIKSAVAPQPTIPSAVVAIDATEMVASTNPKRTTEAEAEVIPVGTEEEVANKSKKRKKNK